MKMQGTIEYSFAFDKEKAADNLRQQLSDSINEAIKAGTVDVTKTTDFMDLYHKALKLDPASVKTYSNEVLNQLDNSLRGLKKWEEAA